MNFIRPEARAALWRWREVLAGGALALLALSWVIGPGGLLGMAGWLLCLVAGALIFVGIQRARFRTGAGGLGVVKVDEGQVAYFGPLTGGAVALSELEQLRLDQEAKPPHWILDMPGQPPLHIPLNAEGAEGLFDIFAALPGLRTERMLAEMKKRGAHQVVIWQRDSNVPPGHRLH
ncbi:MAG: hypothetical protein ACU0BB_01180 [Paracoccaceae bacterium]